MTRTIGTLTLLLSALLFVSQTLHAEGFATDDSGRLYRVVPGKKSFEKVGTVAVTEGKGKDARTYTPTLTDIAMSDLHGLYGISYSELYKIDMSDPGRSKRVGTLAGGVAGFNALAFDEAGTLYAAAGDVLYRVDVEKGAATAIGNIGSGGWSDGDLAFVDGVLYGTFSGVGGSHLVRIDVKTGKGIDIGVIRRVAKPAPKPAPKKAPRDAGGVARGTPVRSVWGLIWDGRKTWALTADGHVLELDLRTARATPQFRMPIDLYGACPALRL